jgi:glycosyltransferase involved in cell wall biosynthesis
MSIHHSKKIAIVSDAVYPYNKGGKEKRIHEIATRLSKRGHDVTIYCMQWWNGENEIMQDGVRLSTISPYYPLYSGKRRSIRQALLFALHCLKLLKKDFDVIDVDHMPHFVLFTTKIVALLKGKKLYASWNEVWGREYWVSYMGFTGTIAAIIEKISAQLPDTVISISTHTTKLFKTLLSSTKHIVTVPCGITLQEIDSVTPSSQTSDIIFAGRLLSHKHVDVLIDSVELLSRQMPNITCLIIGDGPERISLEQYIQKKQLTKHIQIINFLDKHTDLFALFKSAQVFVFPSTREGFGIVVLEANACGIPVIAIDHPDNAAKDLIEHDVNGYVVPLDAKQIVQKVTNILEEKKEWLKLRDVVKEYDWDRIVDKIEEEYER